ncbi:MAG: aminodeoxychorismate synthase component I [bacterium]
MIDSFPLIEHITFIDPAQVFPIFNDQRYRFFLDSGMNGYGLGQYSFIGFDPFLVFKSRGENIEIWTGTTSKDLCGNPFTILRQIIDQYKLPVPEMLPTLPSFLGGGVGYFSYEMGNLMEELPVKAMDDLNIPDCIICLYDIILIFDHKQGQAYISSSGFPEQGGSSSGGGSSSDNSPRHKRAINRIKWVKDRLQLSIHVESGTSDSEQIQVMEVLPYLSLQPNETDRQTETRGSASSPVPTHLPLQLTELITLNPPQKVSPRLRVSACDIPGEFITSNFTQEEYIQAVTKAKQYIDSGDIYQVNLAQRLMTSISVPPFKLYQQLRKINPAPFGTYLDFDEIVIAGSSPERFIMVEDNYVETRPIKGTRPRGKDRSEDKKLKRELLASEKDKAELIMIVDLLRNDLGRVCQYGSVIVNDIRRIETYPTVFHTVATICGKLSPDHDRFDLLKACFPGGSITGAPKIRAMEIIDELEPNKRHIYTGSIGYLSFTGSMDLNIAIRTFLIKDNQVYFHIGGGIVADSLPEDEYLETLHKGKALIEALLLIKAE